MSHPSTSFRPFFSNDSAKFLAARTDGFGARLRAVVNAISLAKVLDEDFLIYWPAKNGVFHGVPSAEATFSPLFVARYCLDPKTVTTSFLKSRYLPFRECKNKESLLKASHIQVENYLSKNRYFDQYPYLSEIVDANVFSAAFASIAFNQYLEAARSLALSIPFNAPVAAVHLRASDVIYSRLQHINLFQDKVVPYPLAQAVANQLKSQGKIVILFGEDEPLCRYLAQQCDCLLASDLASKDFDRNQLAFFDIVLMSRAKEIYAGTSNFSQLAAVVGGGTVIEPTDILSTEVIQGALRRFLETPSLPEGVSPAQAAFAFWAAYFRYPTMFSKEERRGFLDRALEFSPENVLYQLVSIADDLTDENEERATRQLQKLMDTEVRLKTLYPDTPKVTSQSSLTYCIRHRECSLSRKAARKLAPLADAGNMAALLCCALAAMEPVKQKYAKQFLNLREEALGVFDADVRAAAGMTTQTAEDSI